MFHLQRTVLLLTLVSLSSSDVLDFDGRSADELCYMCSCSDDRTSVDCSRRGLTDIPDGNADKVSEFPLFS